MAFVIVQHLSPDFRSLMDELLATNAGEVLLMFGAILVAVIAQIGAYAIPAALLWAVCMAVALWQQPSPDPELEGDLR